MKKIKCYLKKFFGLLIGGLFVCKPISGLLMSLFKTAIPYTVSKMKPGESLLFLFGLEEILDQQINAAAIAYEGGKIHPKHRLMKYHDFFVERINAHDSVIDIGCGMGAVANTIANKACCEVLGVDNNDYNIELAKRLWKHPKLAFVLGRAPECLPDKHYSVVVLSNILEHIPGRAGFLREIKRKINPKKLLLRVPSFQRDWKVPFKAELGIFYFNDPGHYIEYTEESLVEELARAGLLIKEKIVRWGEIWAECE